MKYNESFEIDGLTDEEFVKIEKTTVLKSKASPTGFLVTFRLMAPERSWLGVIGDWMFSDIYHSSRYTSGIYWPHQWKAGYFPHALLGLIEKPKILHDENPTQKIDPSQFVFDWEVLKLGLYEMNKDPETGMFSCTIPLPKGVYNYRFVLEIPEGNPMLMQTMPDPNNLNSHINSKQKFSQLYIPRNNERQGENWCVELPYSGNNKGSIAYDTYHTDIVTECGENQPIGIYLPEGYGNEKEIDKRYPVLYLSHGGRGDHNDWFTCGALNNIMDNLIGSKKVEPMIVVTMNNELLEWKNKEKCIPNLMNYLIPYVESKYRVIANPDGRAFAGLSAGGLLACDVFSTYPEAFRYFGIWSGGQRGNVDFTKEAFRYPKVHIGGGRYDDAVYDFGFELENTLYKNHVSFTSYFPEGGHQWSVWRKLLEDFVSRVLWK